MSSVEIRVDQQSTTHIKQRRRTMLWLVLFIVLPVIGGTWLYLQHAFEQQRLALINSVQEGNATKVRTLLEQGAAPNTLIRFQTESSLLDAIQQLYRRPSHNDISPDETVLMYAADQDRTDIVRLLLKYGADVNRRDAPEGGKTALHYAAGQGSYVSVKMLLDHGATVNVQDGSGLTPLLSAILAEFFEGNKPQPKQSTQCVDLLLQHGAEVDYGTADGSTPLIVAACGPAYGSLSLLIKHGANVNAHDKRGDTPLMRAAMTLQVASVRKLLQSGATVNTQDERGKSALRYAVEEGYAKQNAAFSAALPTDYGDTLFLLIDSGADPELPDKSGKTPLQIATSNPVQFAELELLWLVVRHGLWEVRGR